MSRGPVPSSPCSPGAKPGHPERSEAQRNAVEGPREIADDGDRRSAPDGCGVSAKLLHLLPWLAAALSGFLLTLCFPRANQDWIVWWGLTPLIAAVWFSPGTRWKKAGLGYVAGLVFFSISFGWLGSLADLEGNPWLKLLPLLLACYMALYFAFWSWVIAGLGDGGAEIGNRQSAIADSDSFIHSGTNLRLAFFAAAAWVAHEWVRGWLFSGFGWNGLGAALHGKLAMIQIAEWTGVGGLSFLIVFVNVIAVATIRRFIAEILRGKLRAHWDFSVMMMLVVLTFAFGVRALRHHSPATTLRVASIQANIPQNEKWDAAFEEKIYTRYRDLTLYAAELNPQLIIWPESSLPGSLFVEPNFSFVRGLASRGDFGLLLGSVDFDLEGETQLDFNAAVLMTERGEANQTYRKNHLVPFGEFIPFRESFPLFAMIVGDLVPADFRSGNEFTLLELPGSDVKIAPLICFEDTVGELARKFVLAGGQVLVNVTNDGWFLRSAGAEQHLANAIFRTVETRRPLLRAANTGVTCFVDAHGRVTNALRAKDGSTFFEGVLFDEVAVPVNGPLTFYTRHGEVFSMICFAITAGVVALSVRCQWWKKS